MKKVVSPSRVFFGRAENVGYKMSDTPGEVKRIGKATAIRLDKRGMAAQWSSLKATGVLVLDQL